MVGHFPNEELLYLIVEGTYLNGSPAIETFAANEIADTDGDGLFEFIDAWEHLFDGFVGHLASTMLLRLT